MDVISPSSSVMSVSIPTVMERMPMTQADFDYRFEYVEAVDENKLAGAITRSLSRFVRPFTSFGLLWKTILSFVPILQWLPRYDMKNYLIPDAIGGFMVGVMHIPQGIAYAILAGVPPVVGLYTSFFPVLAYMLFGTSRHNSIGSFAVVALMTGQSVANLASKPSAENMTSVSSAVPEPIDVTTALTMTIGLTQIMVGILGLDFVTTYLSEQLVAGFTTGAAVHVFVTQLKDITGVYHTTRRSGFANAIMRAYDVLIDISRTNVVTLMVSVITMTALFLGKKWVNPFVLEYSPVPIPFELLAVLTGTLASSSLNMGRKYAVAVVGDIPTGLPLPSIPPVRLLRDVLKDGISISVVIMAVHISMAKLLAKKHSYVVDTKQEFFAMGFTSTIASLFPVFPSSCSLARTLVNSSAGTQTQLFAVFSSTFIFLVLQFGGKYLYSLPMCVLASIIIIALLDMFAKLKQLPQLWSLSKVDWAIWVVAFLATACIDVIDGLAIAIVFALVTTVFRQQWPSWHVLANIPGTTEYKDVERYQQVRYVEGVRIVRFDAPLLFTNVDQFRDMVKAVIQRWDDVACNTRSSVSPKTPLSSMSSKAGLQEKVLVIDCSGFVYIDMMGVSCLKETYTDLLKKSIRTSFAAAKAPLRELFELSGFHATVNKNNFFPTIHDAVYFAKHGGLTRGLSNGGSYDTVELSDESTQSSETAYDRKLNDASMRSTDSERCRSLRECDLGNTVEPQPQCYGNKYMNLLSNLELLHTLFAHNFSSRNEDKDALTRRHSVLADHSTDQTDLLSVSKECSGMWKDVETMLRDKTDTQ